MNKEKSKTIIHYNKIEIRESKQYFAIKNLIRNVGIPTNLLGYKYIIEAIIYMISSDSTLFLSEIYIKIAANNRTSSECVEAAIRNAIKKSVNQKEGKLKKSLNLPEDVKISNSVFLNAAKEIVLNTISSF